LLWRVEIELTNKNRDMSNEKHNIESKDNADIAIVVCSSCSAENSKRWDRWEITLNDKDGTSVDVSIDYCENCGHVYNLSEY
jgi:hypothetical protein